MSHSDIPLMGWILIIHLSVGCAEIFFSSHSDKGGKALWFSPHINESVSGLKEVFHLISLKISAGPHHKVRKSWFVFPVQHHSPESPLYNPLSSGTIEWRWRRPSTYRLAKPNKSSENSVKSLDPYSYSQRLSPFS